MMTCCMAMLFGLGLFIPSTLADSTVLITSDTVILLSGPGITLILASGSSLVSYSADTTTLVMNLDADSTVTVKSSNLFRLTNSLGRSTQCSGVDYSYLNLTAESPTTVTVTPSTTVACTSGGGGGGGGGGGAVYPPSINSFLASPSSVLSGQASALSWSVSGASSVRITPAVSATSLNPASGTVTVTPASTTTYTLLAANAYGQNATATTTVTVIASVPKASFSPISQLPSQSATITSPAYCLVNRAGTFFLILDGIRHGIANPGLLFSHGYNFSDAIPDTAAYQSLESDDLLGPNDGALVKSPNDSTVYLISGQAKHGFTSADFFRALGFKFSSVLTIPTPQLNALAEGKVISDPAARHLPGTSVISRGTVYFLDDTARRAYPSLAVFNTWNLRHDFSRVGLANAADLALPPGPAVTPRPSCTGQ